MEPFTSCISPVMPQSDRSRARAGDQSRAGSNDADVSRQILMDERTADSMFVYSNQNLGGQPDPGGELPVYVNSEEQLEVNSASICTFDYGSSLDDQSLLRHVNLQRALGLEGPSRRPSLKSWSSCDKDLQLPRGRPDYGTDHRRGNDDDEVLIDEDELQYHDRAEPQRLLPTKNYHDNERQSIPPPQYMINNETSKSESTSKFEYSLDSEEQSSNPKLFYNGPLASMGSHSTSSFLGPTLQRDRSVTPGIDEESSYDQQHVRNVVMPPRRRRQRRRFSRMDAVVLLGSGFLFLAATIGIVAAFLLGDQDNSKSVATTGFVGQRLPENEETLSPSKSPAGSPPNNISPDQGLPAVEKSAEPSFTPTTSPTVQESAIPSTSPSNRPSWLPTETKSASPSVEPSRKASGIPSSSPSSQPSPIKSATPTVTVSMVPSASPSHSPSLFPSTLHPSSQPSHEKSQVPSPVPSTVAPSSKPTQASSQVPTKMYSDFPTTSMAPSSSSSPTDIPSSLPSMSGEPSVSPSENPLNQLMDMIVDQAFPSTEIALQDQNSAQSQALLWVAGDANSRNLSDERKIQRFALATVSFEVLQAQGGSNRKERHLAANTWLNENDDECRWTGIFCDSLKRVTVMNLAQRGLPGRLPPELALLKDSLQLLDVTNNQFSGEIPSEYGQLSLLRFFRVSRNNLTGNIPDSFSNLRFLQHLNVHRNQLSGPFPNQPLSQMLSLSQARMYFNNFTGTVDSSVCAKGMSIFEVDCTLNATCASICY